MIGAAVIGAESLDSMLAVTGVNQTPLIENDDDGGLSYIYPASSPFPGGERFLDSVLTWIAPADGQYMLRVQSFAAASSGEYTLKVRARRASFEDEDYGATQTIFLDFNGAQLNAIETFDDPFAQAAALLTPLQSFLPRWGLTPEDEAAVVESILTEVNTQFDNLRQASLNGNRATDRAAGHFDVVILNSRDHADPWGQPNVSRVVVGGTVYELGIWTIGIADSIDPGNFDREETAVVLLDFLSEDPQDLNSVNSIPFNPPLTRIDAIGITVGRIIVHEIGHYLGNWHTDNANEILAIMDQGGVAVSVDAGVGPDGVLGTGDDLDNTWTPDEYIANEGVAVGEERLDVNSAFALSTGRVSRDIIPDDTAQNTPLASVRATPTAGDAPLTVEFSAGAVDGTLGTLSYAWDFADGSTGTGVVTTHTYAAAGDYLVKLTVTNNLGDSGQATVLVQVAAQLPTARMTLNATAGPAPLSVSFDASTSTDPDGQIVSYAWDFGDGGTATGVAVTHVYNTPGSYVAKVTVTDNSGATSSASRLITVSSSLSGVASLDTNTDTQTGTTPVGCGFAGPAAFAGTLLGLFAMALARRR